MLNLGIRRWSQALVLGLLAIIMLGANDADGRYERVGHKMICVCSCNQVLLECNHVGCPDSARMIGELRSQVSGGGNDTSILQWFAAKYGPTVLAAPIRGGFDNVAWIMPFAVFLLATLGTAMLIRIWRRRHQGSPVAAGHPHLLAGSGDAMRERIRRETEF